MKTGKENELALSFQIDTEYKAFEEIKLFLHQNWQNHQKMFTSLQSENQALIQAMQEKKVPLRKSRVKGADDTSALFNKIVDEIFLFDPILKRLILYLSTATEDITTRKWLQDYLHDNVIQEYKHFFAFSTLFEKDPILADIKKIYNISLNSVPLHWLFVGKVFFYFMRQYEHYQRIDMVKSTGVKESIHDLRENRIIESEETIVYDYTPLFKLTHSEGGIIKEVFNKDDFQKACNNKISWYADYVLCGIIGGSLDYRTNKHIVTESFSRTGQTPQRAKTNYVVKYRGQEKILPLELLPKYAGLIRGKIRGVPYNEQESKEAELVSHFIEALIDSKTKPAKMPFSAFIEKQLIWREGDTWDEQSTTEDSENRRDELRSLLPGLPEEDIKKMWKKSGERISNTHFEHAEGSLDEHILNEDGEETKRRIDFLKDDKAVDAEEALIKKEIFQYASQDKRLKQILKNYAGDEVVPAGDRKYFERKAEEIRKKFGIKKRKKGK